MHMAYCSVGLSSSRSISNMVQAEVRIMIEQPGGKYV